MIGIFDSGVGGLMVSKYLMQSLPQYNYLYLGDQANLPYGSHSIERVRNLTEKHVNTLFDMGAKIVLIACNTATTSALRYLQQKMPDRKILGVVIPCAEKAVELSTTGNIGVIGTKTTIASNTYDIEIKKVAKEQYNKTVCISQKATPLLVPLIEDHWLNKPETTSIFKKYLRSLKHQNIDTLVLGCTHYAVLEQLAKKIMGKNCNIVCSAQAQVDSFINYLQRHPEIETKLDKGNERQFYTTEDPEKFRDQGRMFLDGMELGKVERVSD